MIISNQQMVDYYLLEQLVAFADNRTLSKAAQQLHISQPAMSSSMRKLESLIGVPLFNRSKSHIELNDNGKIAVKYARKALKANKRVVTKTRQFYHNSHTVRIGACSSFIVRHFLENYRLSHPTQAISVSIADDHDLLVKLSQQKIDLAILHNKTMINGLTTKHYLDEQLLLTLAKTSPLAKQGQLHFADLGGQSILAHGQAAFWLTVFRDNIPQLNLITQEKMSTLDQLVFSADLPVFNSSLVCDRLTIPASKISLPIADQAAHAQCYLSYRTSDQEKLVNEGLVTA